MIARIKKIHVATVVSALLLTGFGNSDYFDKVQTKKKQGKVLPLKVCSLINNNKFHDNLSLIDIDAKVQGGHSNDWAATAIAIARHLGDLGISTDVKVTLSRSDLGHLEQDTPDGFKRLSQVYYANDPIHSVTLSDTTNKKWLISYATDKSVATYKDIKIESDYQALLAKYPGYEGKAVQLIQAKYKLNEAWRLPMSNITSNTLNPDDYSIDESEQKDVLIKLEDLAKSNKHNLQEFNCVF